MKYKQQDKMLGWTRKLKGLLGAVLFGGVKAKNRLRMPFEVKRIRRRPGQSAGEHWRALVEKGAQDGLTCLLVGIVILMLSVFQYFGVTYPIWFGVVLFGCCVVLALLRMRKVRREIENWKLGENGEQYVGQILEKEMRPLGYDVFHDIQIERTGDKKNLDHVLIGPNGVYLIETKAWRKSEKGSPEIEYKNDKLYRSGKMVGDAPIKEALGLAIAANKLFHDLTGRSYYVKPILVFAGWYHRVSMTHESRILFLNETGISSFLPKHKPRDIPSEADMSLLRAKLAVYELKSEE